MTTTDELETCSGKFRKMVASLTQKAAETGNITVYALDLTGDSELENLTNDTNAHLLKIASTVEGSEALMAEVLTELERRQASDMDNVSIDVAVFVNDTNHSDSDLIHAGAETIVSEGKPHGVYCIHHHANI